jgi:epoxyqueuosine reductase
VTTGSLKLPYRRGWFRRRLHVAGNRIAHHSGHLLYWIVSSSRNLNRLSYLPVVPTRLVPRLRSPAKMWPTEVRPVPAELLTAQGIRRDPTAEQAAFEKAPLFFFFTLHEEVRPVLMKYFALPFTVVAPRLFSSTRRLRVEQDGKAERASAAPVLPTDLKAALRAEAGRIGLSAIGIAQYDEKYTFAEFAGNAVGDRVVVCVLEQNYDATQRIPSFKSEEAALSTYGELQDKLVQLARWLRECGYQARPETFEGESLFIHYAVAAGLGQLGVNGQLLTPAAGSRCRINLLTTDAPLEFDEPVDYGLEGVCDKCQICVSRCPVGAIPNHRQEYRGVMKAKLNTKRCLPILLQTEGCSICMKVCPVQRYGLAAVLDEYEKTGNILGKDTDDLEGYDWPIDGKHYGPAAKPRIAAEVVAPPELHFDPSRLLPLTPISESRKFTL